MSEIVRTKSQKLLGMLETVLNLPVTLNRQPSREEAQGTLLSGALSRKGSRLEEDEYEKKFNGELIICMSNISTIKYYRRGHKHGGQGEVRGYVAATVLHGL